MTYSKRFLAALLLGLSLSAFGASSPLQRQIGTITTENLVDAGACTTGGCVEVQVSTAGALTVQVVGTYTAAGGLSAQVTTDGVNWITLGATSTFTRQSTGVATATITSGQQDIYQVSAITGAMRFRVTALGAVTGTATITIQPVELAVGGGSVSGGTDGVEQGSTTSGQSGPLVQGAVTTSAPSYTNAQTSPLSLDTSGNLRVNVVAGGAGGGNVTGGTAHDAAGAAVSPVLMGCYASAAVPTDVSADNDATRAWCLRSGAMAAQPTFGGVLAVAGNGVAGTGVQRVTIASDSTGQVALAAGSATIGALTANQSVNVAQINGVTPLMGSGATGTGSHRVTAATNSPEVTALEIMDDWDESDRAKVNPIAGQAGVAAGSGTISATTQRVTIATDDVMSAAIVGVAHDAAGAAVNPALVGCYASAAAPSDVSADNDATRAWCLRNGARAVQQTYAGVLATTGTGNSGTGVPRVVAATDQPAHALHGHGATGSAVPANAQMAGGRSGANLISFPVSDTTAPITMSTATTTQMVALSGSTKTFIDNLSILAGGTTNVTLVYGTGTNCATSPSNLTGAYPLTAQVGLVLQRIVVPAGQALCVTSSQAVQVSGHVTYTQFAP